MEGRMRSKTGHLARFSAPALVALFLVIGSPAAAYAQVDIDETVDGVGDKVDDTVDEATDVVDETVDKAEETADNATGSDIVDEVTDTVDETVDQVGGTLDSTTDSATDEVDRVVAPVGEALHETRQQAGAIVDSILGSSGGNEGGAQARGRAGGDVTNRDPLASARARDGFVDGFAAVAITSSQPDLAGRALEPVAITTEARGPVESAIQNIGEIARQVAFPLALLILVGAFLVFQGRLDRDDPKLSMAPIDVDSSYLSFR